MKTLGRRRTQPAKIALAMVVALALMAFTTSCAEPPPAAAPLDGRGGGLIAFHSYRDGNSEIYVMNADGSGQTRLTDSPATDECPCISPNGSRVAFTSNRDGNADIYLVGVDGSGLTRLTDTPAGEMHPSWTPDGKQLVYAANGDIWIMDLDSGEARRLTQGLSAELPFVTPDASRIVYSTYGPGSYDVFIMNIDGTDQVPVANTTDQEVFGRPSPDGKYVAFMKTRVLYVAGTDGSGLQRIQRAAEDPCWSPDGTRIVFQSNRSGNYDIFVMNSDGTGVVNLTRNSGNDQWPSWAPMSTE